MDGLESLRSIVTIVFTDRPVGFVQGPDPGGLAGSVASKTAFRELKYKILPLFKFLNMIHFVYGIQRMAMTLTQF